MKIWERIWVFDDILKNWWKLHILNCYDSILEATFCIFCEYLITWLQQNLSKLFERWKLIYCSYEKQQWTLSKTALFIGDKRFPSWACLEVLHVYVSFSTLFTRFYMMRVKFFVHDNLPAAENFYELFPCNIQNLNAADIFHFCKIFYVACKILDAHFQILNTMKILPSW